MKITPKDWGTFQQYKDREPKWIKLHRTLLNNYDWHCMPDLARAVGPMLWLLASEFNDGEIVRTPDEIAFRLHMRGADLAEAIKHLVAREFFEADDEMKVACGISVQNRTENSTETVQNRTTEREGESETESEKERRSLRSRVRSAEKKLKPKAKPLKLTAPVDKPKNNNQPPPPQSKPTPTRIDPELKMSARNMADARQCGLREVDAAKQWQRFKNHFAQAAGSKAVSLDWNLRWHNWCLEEADRRGLTPTMPTEMAPPERSVADWERILRTFRHTENWISAWGPPPHEPGCLVPKQLLKPVDYEPEFPDGEA